MLQNMIYAQSARLVIARQKGLEVPDTYIIETHAELLSAAKRMKARKYLTIDPPKYPATAKEYFGQLARRKSSDDHCYASLIFEDMGVEINLTVEKRETTCWHLSMSRYLDLEAMDKVDLSDLSTLILRVPDATATRIAEAFDFTEGPHEGVFKNTRHFFAPA